MAFAYGYRNRETVEAAASGTVGGLVGGLQTMLLREYADTPMATDFLKGTTSTAPFLMKQMKGFGSPSSVLGWGIGTPAAIVGGVGLFMGKGVRHAGVASGLLGYGVTAAGSGILSGALPTPAWKNGIAADPANPISSVSVTRNQVMRSGLGQNVASQNITGAY